MKNNILKGKLKTLTVYEDDSVNNLNRFYYYYDSISGFLNSITLESKLSGQYFRPGSIIISKIDNNNIIYTNVLDKRKFIIKINEKQIIGIYEFDTVTLIEVQSTYIKFKNDNTIDSISDVGKFNFFTSEFNYFGFQFDANHNCTSFTTTWTENYTGTPINKRSTTLIAYSSLLNTNIQGYYTPSSITGGFDIGSVANFITYSLGVDGYYIIKQNQYLVDSIYSNGTTTKYNYTFTNGNISKVLATYPPTLFYRVNDMTYYE